MGKQILIIQGHPDPDRHHLGYALADAYAAGARAAGHEVSEIDVSSIEFPFVRSAADFFEAAPPPAIAECQQRIARADHIVFFYPLWLGDMPALLKAFLETTFRAHFGGVKQKKGIFGRPMRGKSARVVVTMGMPALVYRWFFGAHSLRSFERNILGLVGFRPVRRTILGAVEQGGKRGQARRLRLMERLGTHAA